MMTALRWAGLTCRAAALVLAGYVIWTGWQPTLRWLDRYEVRIEIRPRGLIVEPLPRWT